MGIEQLKMQNYNNFIQPVPGVPHNPSNGYDRQNNGSGNTIERMMGNRGGPHMGWLNDGMV